MLEIREETDCRGGGAGQTEQDAVLERRPDAGRPGLWGAFRPRHRYGARPDRPRHHQARHTGGRPDVGVAQPDPEQRQRQDHRDHADRRTSRNRGGSNAGHPDSRDREHGHPGEHRPDQHRGPLVAACGEDRVGLGDDPAPALGGRQAPAGGR